jgi:hypothetical protein
LEATEVILCSIPLSSLSQLGLPLRSSINWWLNQQKSVSHGSGDWKSDCWVPGWWGLFLLTESIFSLGTHSAFPQWVLVERREISSLLRRPQSSQIRVLPFDFIDP